MKYFNLYCSLFCLGFACFSLWYALQARDKVMHIHPTPKPGSTYFVTTDVSTGMSYRWRITAHVKYGDSTAPNDAHSVQYFSEYSDTQDPSVVGHILDSLKKEAHKTIPMLIKYGLR